MNAATAITMSNHSHAQQGAALVVSLLFLLMLTLIGVTSAMVSSLEERMSGNLRDRNLAFQAAESALRAGELYIAAALPPTTAVPTETFGCSDLYDCSLVGDLTVDSVWAAGGHSHEYDGYTAAAAGDSDHPPPTLRENPRYLVEVVDPIPTMPPGCTYAAGAQVSSDPNCVPVCTYRVTARGVGSTATAKVFLQSTYRYPAISDPSLSRGGKCHA